MYLQPTNCLQATFSRLFVENRCVKMVFFGALPSKQTHQNPTRKIILPTLLGVVRWEVTLPETNGFVSENRPKPKRKGSFSNHPFSEAKMLVSGRVIFVCFFFFSILDDSMSSLRCWSFKSPGETPSQGASHSTHHVLRSEIGRFVSNKISMDYSGSGNRWWVIICYLPPFTRTWRICWEFFKTIASLKLTANTPARKVSIPKGKFIVFQPSIFRCDLLVSGRGSSAAMEKKNTQKSHEPMKAWLVTPWKLNIAPKNRPSPKETSLPTIIFQVPC